MKTTLLIFRIGFIALLLEILVFAIGGNWVDLMAEIAAIQGYVLIFYIPIWLTVETIYKLKK